MDSEIEPLLLQATKEHEGGKTKESLLWWIWVKACRGLWWMVGWINTHPWARGVVLVLGFLLPFALSAYMFIYCKPLDIDLSYNAFEVRNHSSPEHLDALAIALIKVLIKLFFYYFFFISMGMVRQHPGSQKCNQNTKKENFIRNEAQARSRMKICWFLIYS